MIGCSCSNTHKDQPPVGIYILYTYKEKKRTPVTYGEGIKALYGLVDAVKFFNDNISSSLIDNLDFKRNLYDICVLNKNIDGSHFKIMWYEDNLKLSYRDPKVVTSIIHILDKKYGDIIPVSVSRGRNQ